MGLTWPVVIVGLAVVVSLLSPCVAQEFSYRALSTALASVYSFLLALLSPQLMLVTSGHTAAVATKRNAHQRVAGFVNKASIIHGSEFSIEAWQLGGASVERFEEGYGSLNKVDNEELWMPIFVPTRNRNPSWKKGTPSIVPHRAGSRKSSRFSRLTLGKVFSTADEITPGNDFSPVIMPFDTLADQLSAVCLSPSQGVHEKHKTLVDAMNSREVDDMPPSMVNDMPLSMVVAPKTKPLYPSGTRHGYGITSLSYWRYPVRCSPPPIGLFATRSWNTITVHMSVIEPVSNARGDPVGYEGRWTTGEPALTTRTSLTVYVIGWFLEKASIPATTNDGLSSPARFAGMSELTFGVQYASYVGHNGVSLVFALDGSRFDTAGNKDLRSLLPATFEGDPMGADWWWAIANVLDESTQPFLREGADHSTEDGPGEDSMQADNADARFEVPGEIVASYGHPLLDIRSSQRLRSRALVPLASLTPDRGPDDDDDEENSYNHERAKQAPWRFRPLLDWAEIAMTLVATELMLRFVRARILPVLVRRRRTVVCHRFRLLAELLRLRLRREEEELIRRNEAADIIQARWRYLLKHRAARRELTRDRIHRDITIVMLRLRLVRARLLPVLALKRRGVVHHRFQLLAEQLRLRQCREDEELVRRNEAAVTLQARWRYLQDRRAARQELARTRFHRAISIVMLRLKAENSLKTWRTWRASTATIETWWRGPIATRRACTLRATVKCQAWWRGNRWRRSVQRRVVALGRLRRAVNNHRVRLRADTTLKAWKSFKESVVGAQAAVRGFVARITVNFVRDASSNVNDPDCFDVIDLGCGISSVVRTLVPLTRLGKRSAVMFTGSCGLVAKCPPSEENDDERYARSCQDIAREIAVLRMLGSTGPCHSNLVRVVSMSTIYFSIVMQAGKGTLQMYLKRSSTDREKRGDAEIREGVRIAAGMVEGITFLHGRGIIHSDLKPGNVLMDHNKNPRIIDFGFAGAEGSPFTLAAIPYLAPEVHETMIWLEVNKKNNPPPGSHPVLRATNDVYSLGLMLLDLVACPPQVAITRLGKRPEEQRAFKLLHRHSMKRALGSVFGLSSGPYTFPSYEHLAFREEFMACLLDLIDRDPRSRMTLCELRVVVRHPDIFVKNPEVASLSPDVRRVLDGVQDRRNATAAEGAWWSEIDLDPTKMVRLNGRKWMEPRTPGEASTIISSAWRRWVARRHYTKIIDAVTLLQRVVLLYLTRCARQGYRTSRQYRAPDVPPHEPSSFQDIDGEDDNNSISSNVEQRRSGSAIDVEEEHVPVSSNVEQRLSGTAIDGEEDNGSVSSNTERRLSGTGG